MKKLSLILSFILILTFVPLQPAASSDYTATPMVAVGLFHTIALNAYGRVYSTEISDVTYSDPSDFGQCNTYSWRNITEIAAGEFFSAGLVSDGTVVFTGLSDGSVTLPTGETESYTIDVSSWNDIVHICAGAYFIAGLKADGTVVISGCTNSMDTSQWSNIAQISAGDFHLVALKDDGTCAATGIDYLDNTKLSSYSDVKTVSAGGDSTMLIFNDGTLHALGKKMYSYTDDEPVWEGKNWVRIEIITTGSPTASYMIAIDDAGVLYTDAPATDSAYSPFIGQTDVLYVDMGYARNTYASAPFGVIIKKDGTLIAGGFDYKNRAKVTGWNLYEKPLEPNISDTTCIAAAKGSVAALSPDRKLTYTGSENTILESWKSLDIVQIDAFPYSSHFIAVTSGGDVLCTDTSFDLSSWGGAVKVSIGRNHLVALRWDGSVLTTSSSDGSYLAENIADIHAGHYMTMCISHDGSAHLYSWDSSFPYQDFTASQWKNAKQISVGSQFIVGISANNTLLFSGINTDSQGDFDDSWTDIVYVSAGGRHTLGVKSDGTVVAVGNNLVNQCDVSSWKNIASVCAGNTYSIGLSSDPELLLANKNTGLFDLSTLNILPDEYLNIDSCTVSDNVADVLVNVSVKTPGTYRVFVAAYNAGGRLTSKVSITTITITGEETEPISVPAQIELSQSSVILKAFIWDKHSPVFPTDSKEL